MVQINFYGTNLKARLWFQRNGVICQTILKRDVNCCSRMCLGLPIVEFFESKKVKNNKISIYVYQDD